MVRTGFRARRSSRCRGELERCLHAVQADGLRRQGKNLLYSINYSCRVKKERAFFLLLEIEMHRFFLSILAFGIAAFVAVTPADASPRCSAGSAVGWARVNAPSGFGPIVAIRQYAWDGGSSVVQVCNLTGNTVSIGYWQLYSGEIDSSYPGICVSVVGTNGSELFSCATPNAVQRAFSARNQPRNVLRFFEWQAGLAPNLTR
ncbi:hypothetical protein N0B44_05550 [Roseibacterium beibuensis]|uniref:hypothetical protein n=1 Tax=[Roseibacterium] beibuensis TaxID=1193142 RepID=UPI00217F1B28|nr:hypothetical protein [Roseibacterium beibuensis]MCS6622370.1 hypothetical protein [Roseibacterium beibuensis]